MSKLLTEERLVVNQKAKLIELTNQYLIRDAEGNELGRIQQEGQSTLKKVLRFVGDVDQFLTHTMAIYDSTDTKLVEVVRPRKVFKSKFEVKDGSGRMVGRILQNNVFGKITFEFQDASETKLGAIKAENWRAWDFAIVDANDNEIGRIDKKFVGVAKAMFTTADNYVVDIQPSVTGDLRLMVLGAALAVDTALKQDTRFL
ncbi:MAG TPA: phospholipid scramblase-related protein [Actinomycetota bacterium]